MADIASIRRHRSVVAPRMSTGCALTGRPLCLAGLFESEPVASEPDHRSAEDVERDAAEHDHLVVCVPDRQKDHQDDQKPQGLAADTIPAPKAYPT